MIVVDNNKVTIVRGDTGSLTVAVNEIVDGEEQEYTPQTGDTFVFRMAKSFGGEPLIEKELQDGEIEFASADTEDLPFGDYFYDVTLENDGVKDHIIQADKNDPNFTIAEAV